MGSGEETGTTSGVDGRPRVLWVTNAAAPYRFPVWRHLADRYALTVGLLSRDSDISRIRGSDWRADAQVNEDNPFELVVLRGIRFPKHPERYVLVTGAVKLVRSHEVVVLGGWDSLAYLQLRLLCLFAGVPCVGFYESTLQSQRYKRGPIRSLRSAFMRSLPVVVAPGRAAADALRSVGVRASRVRVGFNAVDVDDVHTRAAMVRRANPAVLLDERWNFVIVAQLIERKNVDGLLRAMAVLGSAKPNLTIVGDGHMRESLEELADNLDLQERVTFLGPVPYERIPDVLVGHSTLVLPSLEEVWGLVANEALAAGLHVVTSDRCGVASSIEAMRGVWLCRPDDEALAQAMLESAQGWEGPIAEPEILQNSPAVFADVFDDAIRSVMRSR